MVAGRGVGSFTVELPRHGRESWDVSDARPTPPDALPQEAAGNGVRPAGRRGVRGWKAWELLGVAAGLGLILLLNDRVDLLWTAAPWWLAAWALATAALLVRRVPPLVSALWLLGLASYGWSMTPGATLLAAIWGLTWVAAAAVGRMRSGLFLVVLAIVLNDLVNALALNAFGLQSYLSGSVHYLLGAKALVLLPVALAGMALGRRRWSVVSWWSLATVAVFAALISGSRGVYLPMLVMLPAVLLKAHGRRELRRLVVGLVAGALVVASVDAVTPFHPVSAALSDKASAGAQASAVASDGSFTLRLRYWDQGLGMVVTHPLGVGLGGFRGTIHAFQEFPMLWSSSPHNVFVETAATLGWPGLAVLVALLVVAFVRAWRSPRWPWALALMGLWATLAVDVTADYPSVLAIAFAVVGACLGTEPVSPGRGSFGWAAGRSALAAVTVASGVVLSAYWYAPCAGTDCLVGRWRGVEYRVLAGVGSLPGADRGPLFARLERLYPRSLWVLQLEQKYAGTLEERVAVARRIAQSYPLQSWRNYLTWADLSLEAGDVVQAKKAVRAGLAVFGPDAHRYPEHRADPEGFQAWLQRANEILALP